MENLLLKTLLFLLPFCYIKHFSTSNAYVNGILVDYLIPKVWLVDVLIFILLLVWIIKGYLKRTGNLKNLLFYIWCFFVILIFSNLLFLKLPLSSFTYAARLLLYILFGIYIAIDVLPNNSLYFILKPMLFSTVFEILIVIAQWFKQGSLAGYWFLGEPSFSSATLRVAKVNFFGVLKVIPYGTFPHPNALAGFLSLIFLWTFYCFWKERKLYFLVLLLFIAGGLFLTFSQAAWLATFLSTALLIMVPSFGSLKIKIPFLNSYVAGNLLYRIQQSLSVIRRVELSKYALQMFKDNVLLGVGINNSTRVLPRYGRISGPCAFVQPVHNIYLLIFAELGLFTGLSFLAIFLFSLYTPLYSYLKTKNAEDLIIFVSMFHILFLGLLDHYFWTLPQTMLLIWLTIGMSLSRLFISTYETAPA